MGNFKIWSQQFGLFKDEVGLWRCCGRLSNSNVPFPTSCPVLLNKDHHLTRLIIRRCHEKVMRSGLSGTLTELRSGYWLIRGRQLIKKLLRKFGVP